MLFGRSPANYIRGGKAALSGACPLVMLCGLSRAGADKEDAASAT